MWLQIPALASNACSQRGAKFSVSRFQCHNSRTRAWRRQRLLFGGSGGMTESRATGGCLCGRVSYEITGNIGIFQYCHCSRCRKFTGSAFASNLLVSPDQLRWITGESLVARFELEKAKYFATAFCTCCGSSLPWLAQGGKVIIVPAGTLDSDPGIRPSQNLFCASRAGWYEAPSALPEYDELPKKSH